MAYTISTVSPTPAWVTVSATGTITIDSLAIPDEGYQGAARFLLSDGTRQVFLDIPIDIAPSYAWAAANTQIVDWAETSTITWAATVGASFTSTQIFAPVDLVWAATVGASFEDTVGVLATYEDSITLYQSNAIGSDGLAIYSGSVTMGQTVGDEFSDGQYSRSIAFAQSNEITASSSATYGGSVSLGQSIANSFAGEISSGGSIAESALTTGLTFAQSSLYSGTTAANQARMTDGTEATYAATNSVADRWIEVSFAEALVSGLLVGGGLGVGFGNMAAYLNGRTIQYWDGAAWVQIATIAGVADSGVNQFKVIHFPATTTTKLRIFFASSWVATADMYPYVISGATGEADLKTGLTFAQSSNFSGTTIATQTTMTDGDYTTVAATQSGVNWIECSFAATTVRGLAVANSSTGGWNSTYLNGRTIQYWDGAAWVDLTTISTTVNDVIVKVYFPATTTTKLRIYSASSFLATSEMYPIELT